MSRFVGQGIGCVPTRLSLPEDVWRTRHRMLTILVRAHVVAIFAFAVVRREAIAHSPPGDGGGRRRGTRAGDMVGDGWAPPAEVILSALDGGAGAAWPLPEVRASLGPVGPADTIVCVDCGGRCQRLPFEAPELGWQVGDVVTYRCRDCADVWYLEVVVDDLVQKED